MEIFASDSTHNLLCYMAINMYVNLSLYILSNVSALGIMGWHKDVCLDT